MSSSFFFAPPPQVKICGLKTAEDAKNAIQAGANALGFNFYRLSKRFIPLETALKITPQLPSHAARIAVVVNPTAAEIQSLLKTHVWDAIQFHGDESPQFCKNSGFPIWIKAIRISTHSHSLEETIEKIRLFPTPYILLDTDAGNSYGGTGTLINLSFAARIVQALPDKHFLLAGGLRPENVKHAIVTVHPFAVDISSGIENELGFKDLVKMQTFIQAARS